MGGISDYLPFPIGATPNPSGHLINQISDADGVNQLINPIDGSPILLDEYGNPRTDNGLCTIGAVQAAGVPEPLTWLVPRRLWPGVGGCGEGSGTPSLLHSGGRGPAPQPLERHRLQQGGEADLHLIVHDLKMIGGLMQRGPSDYQILLNPAVVSVLRELA